ncbi:transcription factor grauzone-like [Anastrepha obliqua]|uniref:transcription factor grauzone-like n=1 Tax=Anastrepha obliqua TaxID=95512 RepID=UPI00240A54C3|nr:transcription factor grauzone-like [Anastrepha obliqua]
MFYEQSCLLCLEKTSATDGRINIDSEDPQSVKIHEAIKQHFREELSMIPFLTTKVVCNQCWELVQSFDEFYVRVQKAHLAASDKLKSLQELEIEVKEIKVETNTLEEFISLPNRRSKHSRGLETVEKNVEYKSIAPQGNGYNTEQDQDVNEENLVIKCEAIQDDTLDAKNSPQILEDESESRSSVSEDVKKHEEEKALQRAPHKILRAKGRPRKKRTKEKRETKQQNKKRHKTTGYDEFIAQNFTLICFLCQKSLTDFKELKSHFRKHHKTIGYVMCCGKKLLNRGVLVDHINVHNNPEYFKCQHCAKVLCDRNGLEKHLQYFHGSRERTYHCTICSKSFFSSKVLARHCLIHAPDEQKNIKCTQCDKAFSNKYSMKQHLALVHLNLYAKICDICGKALNGNEAFRRHQEEHAGIPASSVKCNLCNAELKTKYGLARHMKTMHTEKYQTPQVCPFCSKLSPTLMAHRSHIEYMHLNKKKHACKLCDKAFKSPKSLQEHMTTHTGEVFCTCTFCPQTFNSKSNMYTHRKRKHPKEWAEKCAKKRISIGMGQNIQKDVAPMIELSDASKANSENNKMFNDTYSLLCLEGSKKLVDLDPKEDKGLNKREVIELHFKEEVYINTITLMLRKIKKRYHAWSATKHGAELRKHMRLTHLNSYAKICDICGISIKGRDALERHQSEHAGIPRKLIKCDLCDAALTTKYGLARHMKTMHTEEYQTPQVCPICSKVSPSLQAHRNHIKYMHSLQRKHVCKLCDKAFKRLTDFKEHMATHTGEALYTCSFCPQTFKSNANMYSHRKKKHVEWAEQCALKKSLAVPLKQATSVDH